MAGTGAARMLFAAILLSALLAASANAASYPDSAKGFGYLVVSEGEGFSVENFTCDGAAEYAIVSNGEPLAFLAYPDGQGAAPAIVEDEKGIAGALECYYDSGGRMRNLSQAFSEIHDEIGRLAGRDDRGEERCRVLLGTDRNPCVSFDTCQYACYSVTSFCQPVALGAGKGFISAMWLFENGSAGLDAAYAAEEGAYLEFAASPGKETALGYLGALDGAAAAAESAAGSALFYEYSFCFSPDYPAYELYGLGKKAARHYRNASAFLGLPEASRAIASRTKMAMEKKAMYALPEIEESNDAGTAGISAAMAAESSESQGGMAEFFVRLYSFFFWWIG